MLNMPAICKSPTCGILFDTALAIQPNNASLTILGTVKIGPCPNCGNDGELLSGRYSSYAGSYTVEMFKRADYDLLIKLKEVVREGISSGDAAKTQRRLETLRPGWTNLWGSLDDDDPMVAIHLLWLLLAFLTLALTAYQVLNDDGMSDEQLRNEALKIFYESQSQIVQDAGQKKNNPSQSKAPKKRPKKTQKSFYGSRKRRVKRPDS